MDSRVVFTENTCVTQPHVLSLERQFQDLKDLIWCIKLIHRLKNANNDGVKLSGGSCNE